jgi:hypothetical protein
MTTAKRGRKGKPAAAPTPAPPAAKGWDDPCFLSETQDFAEMAVEVWGPLTNETTDQLNAAANLINHGDLGPRAIVALMVGVMTANRAIRRAVARAEKAGAW